MRTGGERRAGRRRGITLLECIVYISLVGLITGVAVVALGRSWGTTARMARTGDALAAALRAGERWRADIRDASGAVQPLADGAGCRIPKGAGAIEWRWHDAIVWRRDGGDEVPWLGPATASTMSAEARDGVVAWRWEVRLASEWRESRFEPWHSFVAVPGGVLATR